MARIKEQVTKVEKEKREKFKKSLAKFERKITTNDEENLRKDSALSFYNNLSDTEKETFHRELEKKKIRDSYINYLRYIYPDYIITKFHGLLANICQSVVEKIENGQKVYLCISCPPQHGKSMSVTETLPSWFIGRNPDLRCIVTAYNADVAEKFGDKNRQKIKQFGKDLFDIEISDSQDNKTLWDIANHQGGMVSTGILGGLTSNGGALVIVDDPFKNGEEADNPEIREKIYRVFSDSVYTRARGKGYGIIVIHTRWNDDDLIGRLLKQGGWLCVNIPCVWEKGEDKLLHRRIGETLCPELGFDAEWAERTRKILGNRKFNALYQGKPYIDGGNIVKREWLKFYNERTKPAVFDELTLSADLTFGETKKSSDNVCIGVWGRVGANHYLLKRVKEKMDFVHTLNAIRLLCASYPQCSKKVVEKKANGKAAIDTLNREIGGFVPFDPKSTSKQGRLELSCPYFEAGNVYFPDETIEPNIEDDIQELLKFPNGEHDDFVDMTTQYLLSYEYKYSGKINTNSVYKTLSRAIRGFRA